MVHHHSHNQNHYHNKQTQPRSFQPNNNRERNAYPTHAAPQTRKEGFVDRIKKRFQEQPATREEIGELKLKSERERYRADFEAHRTRIAKAKQERPSKLRNLFANQEQRRQGAYGGGRRRPSGKRRPYVDNSYERQMGDNLLMNSDSFKGSDSMLGVGNDMFGFGSEQRGSKKQQKGNPWEMTFGKGAQDMLSF